MSLKEYKSKRDFHKTSEPQTSRPAPVSIPKSGTGAFAIQEHGASHLHYDLRLEERGVLKSWAVPKTPPLKAGEKRLAIETEDHPLGYQDFEGVIPDGQYGAGTVRIWDKGTYVPLEIADGKRIIEIRGGKLKGVFALIKLKPKPGEKPGPPNWLFFKVGSKPPKPDRVRNDLSRPEGKGPGLRR